MAQVIICCPSSESMTEQDRKEIYNLLEWKKKIKRFKKKGLTNQKASSII